jgi:DNA-binding transcriptional ArsR family regulator
MDIFFALSDPRRREIVRLVAERGQLSAGEICREFDISAQAISQHLRILKECGLLQVERSAQRRIYRMNTGPILELDRWARETTRLWDERLGALDRVLDLEKKKNAKMVIVRQRQTNRRRN